MTLKPPDMILNVRVRVPAGYHVDSVYVKDDRARSGAYATIESVTPHEGEVPSATFHPGKKYKTRDGHDAGITEIRDLDGALDGWVNFAEGRTKVCWHSTGRMHPSTAQHYDNAFDLMPSEEDVTDGSTRFWFEVEPNDPRLAELAAKRLESYEREVPSAKDAIERLDGTDRRVEAIRQGLTDAGDLLLKHEDRMKRLGEKADGAHTRYRALNKQIEQVLGHFGLQIGDYGRITTMEGVTPLATRMGNIQDRVSEMDDRLDRFGIELSGKTNGGSTASLAVRVSSLEATLARIEDCLTAEKPRYDVAISMLEKRIAKIDGKGAEGYEGCCPSGRSMSYSKPPAGMHDYSVGPNSACNNPDCSICYVQPIKRVIKGGWINILDTGDGLHVGYIHPTREKADSLRDPRHTACIQIPDFTEGEGL